MLRESPIISYLDPEGAAEATGQMRIGDRVLHINGFSLIDKSLDQARDLLSEAARIGRGRYDDDGTGGARVLLELEFDVVDAVVPTRGVFVASIAKRGARSLGLTIKASKESESSDSAIYSNSSSSSSSPSPNFIISVVKPGSVAHRSGIVDAGDRLLAIDGLRLDDATLEEATHLLKTSDDVVKLTIEKDETYAEEDEDGCSLCFTVELRRRGKRSLTSSARGLYWIRHPAFIPKIMLAFLSNTRGRNLP